MSETHSVPLKGVCPVCDSEYDFIIRRQGGGKPRKFCSAKCRSKDWARGNGGKRKANIIAYDSKPISKEKKARRQRLDRLRKYGWTEADFQKQLHRQNHQCNGCLKAITETTARIDHDHVSGRVRGLLCDQCNWALGLAQDSPTILRRLMAHLDYQRERTTVYLIGALKNSRIPHIGNTVRQEGFDVMDEWFTPGEHADENWQAYEGLRGRSYKDALRGRAAQNVFLFDRSYIDHADIVVLVMPAGKSAMLELGYAGGRNKHTVLFLDGEDPSRYDVMPGLAEHVYSTEAELVAGLKRLRTTIFEGTTLHE